MGDSHSGHDDDARSLDGFRHVVGGQGDFHGALALIAEKAELGAAQGDAGLFNVGEVHLSETGLIPEADLLALQCAVGGHGLAHGTSAQDGNRHVLQITHVHCDFLLIIFGSDGLPSVSPLTYRLRLL